MFFWNLLWDRRYLIVLLKNDIFKSDFIDSRSSLVRNCIKRNLFIWKGIENALHRLQAHLRSSISLGFTRFISADP